MMGVDGRPLGRVNGRRRAPARWVQVQWRPYAVSGVSGDQRSPVIGRRLTYELRGGTWHPIEVELVTWQQAIAAGAVVATNAYPPGRVNSEMPERSRQVQLSHRAAAGRQGVWAVNEYEV